MVDVTANATTAGDSLETLRENLNLLRTDLSGFSGMLWPVHSVYWGCNQIDRTSTTL